jgi:hypothetical protein
MVIEQKLTCFCGSSRFLWNKCLALNLERLEKGQSILWYLELAFWLTLWKPCRSRLPEHITEMFVLRSYGKKEQEITGNF